ncbi:MAG: hypothetical protein LBR56_01530 [Sporomusaceae bacterium]|jgi:signal transduction histidine kinase|nr:hypothetical protein [Sporomusaceae bacterium]
MTFLKTKTTTLNKYYFILSNLLNTLEHCQTFLANTPDTIYLIFAKPSYSLKYVSSSCAETDGYYPKDFYQSPALFNSLIHPEDFLKIKKSLKTAARNLTSQLVSFRLRKIDKTFVNFDLKTIPVPAKYTFIYAIASKDVPKQLPFYDLAYWERLSAVSQMAASVAHEIRNPMTTVRGYLQFFSGKADFAPYKEQFELVINELDRANLLIKEYLSLNQNKRSTSNMCQLNNIIHSIYPLLKADANSMNKDINIYLGNIPPLCLDEKEIRQLILNMVRNGLEAMSGMKDRTTVSISTYLEEGSVFLAIKDQGAGMAQNVLENIGKTFLTTKEQGTGLGLMVCYKIASNHAAKIEVNSSPSGTDFLIKIPLPK